MGVFIHLFYADLTREVCGYLANLPEDFAIYVSTDTEEKAEIIRLTVTEYFPASPLTIKILPNRGWDIGPFVAGFAEEIRKHPIGLKIHAKKSDNQQQLLFGMRWRLHLFSELMGSKQRVRDVLEDFVKNPTLGVVSAMHWTPNLPFIKMGVNFPHMKLLLSRIGSTLEPDQHIDFPSGSMFWFRAAALSPLLDLQLKFEDFDPPSEQTRDGTVAHAIERSIYYFSEKAGFGWKVLEPVIGVGAVESSRKQRLAMLARAQVQYYPRLAASFVGKFTAAIPAYIARHAWRNKSEVRADSVLKKPATPVRLPMPEQWSSVQKRASVKNAKLDVVMPVYRGYEDTLACIFSVLRNVQEFPFELIVINDTGPDQQLNAELKSLADAGFFTYLTNETNQGFVRTANRGIALHDDRDVILLNSDTLVYGNWIDRMIRHANADKRIATITPFSNNATICSYPNTNATNTEGLELDFERLDQLAAEVNALSRNDVPTGVGFCFYMRRSAIQQCGALDAETFGRGYGEENDFCMRASKQGFKNVLAHDIFVYHTGEVSFSESKLNLRDAAQGKLRAKHPKYPSLVWHYVKSDPSLAARIRLDARRIREASNGRLYVFVTHVFGGGTEKYVRDLIALAKSEDAVVLTLRVTESNLFELSDEIASLTVPNFEKLTLKNASLLVEVLQILAPSLIHVQSVAGLGKGAIKSLLATIQKTKIPYIFTWHDHMMLCHRIKFLKPGGKYCGEPPIEECRKCLRNDWTAWNEFDPAERREVFGRFLKDASYVICPSASAMERTSLLVGREKLVLKPHVEPENTGSWITSSPMARLPLKIAIIGEIVTAKGAKILAEMVADAEIRKLPIEYSIVGPSSRMELSRFPRVRITGRYAGEAEAAKLLREIGPHLCLIPSIWPETYCYTLSSAFDCGLPPVVFDHGAQAERVRNAGWGRVLPRAIEKEPATINDVLLSLPIDAMWSERKKLTNAGNARSLSEYYSVKPARGSGDQP